MSKRLFIIIIMLFTVRLDAQERPGVDWTAFRDLVLATHPLALQAELFRERADAELLRSKGGFDPKVYADYLAKNFNGKNYFQYSETGLKWPIGLGLEIKANYNWAYGDYLNPESALPANGQAAAGFNWTLGQGLLIDERRAALQQGRIGLLAGEAERSAVRNDLLVEAAKAYWSWVAAQDQLQLYEQALGQAQIRFAGLLDSWRQGDKPAIDTLEAFIQVQNRQLDINFARIDLQNAQLAICNFLWQTDGAPYRPQQLPRPATLRSGDVVPATRPDTNFILTQARTRHPELRLYEAKLQTLEIERRLKQEKRKPVLDLSYQLLGSGWQFSPSEGSGLDVVGRDIKWGVQFSFPLLNRKARGDWQSTQVKLAQTQLGRRQKQTAIEIKVQQYVNELNNLAGQIALYRGIVQNYRLLLDGENAKFAFGESSVFLINTREQRWLDAQIKLVKLLAEYRKTEAALQWSAGVLAP